MPGASSVPSFSAVPDISLMVSVDPCGTSNRYSQNGCSACVSIAGLEVLWLAEEEVAAALPLGAVCVWWGLWLVLISSCLFYWKEIDSRITEERSLKRKQLNTIELLTVGAICPKPGIDIFASTHN